MTDRWLPADASIVRRELRADTAPPDMRDALSYLVRRSDGAERWFACFDVAGIQRWCGEAHATKDPR